MSLVFGAAQVLGKYLHLIEDRINNNSTTCSVVNQRSLSCVNAKSTQINTGSAKLAIRQVVVVLCLPPTLGMRSVPQYARDVSEHCKRRDSLPSVFLSRRVMEADAQVLHFYRLDVPYSCITTVRTESGHNIIMVLDLYYDRSDQEACKDGHQLAVYDFAETFGGYWGPMPNVVLDQDSANKPVYTKQYTLATRPPPVTSTTTKTTSGMPKYETSPADSSTAETQSFIDIEVPLVNLSASLIPDEKHYEKPFDPDEFFDLFYDVMPRPGQSYQTSILPLVQIAVRKQDDLRKDGVAGGEPRYELDYGVGPFTPDNRLTTPVWSTTRKINTNRNTNRWKKKKLQDKGLHTREPAKSRKLKQYSLPTTQHMASYEHILPQAITENNLEVTKEPFNLIDDIMKSLNESGALNIPEASTHSDILAVFDTSEKLNRNLSVYLAPYATLFPVSDIAVSFAKNHPNIYLDGTTENRVSTGDSSVDGQENSTPTRAALGYSTSAHSREFNVLERSDGTLEEGSISKKKVTIPVNKMDTVKLAAHTATLNETTTVQGTVSENPVERTNLGDTDNVTDAVLFPMTTTDKRSLSGTLVDHESWENVVQSAPVMAGLLNQHAPEPGGSPSLKKSADEAAAQKRGQWRRKRYIAPIGVGARPHRRPTQRASSRRPKIFNAVDMHEFARLMELPDDQMNNHVLIKLNPNMSRQLFDMCDDSNWSKSRFLVLFNTSRVILSITNFTMPHVMVALTTARPLALLEPRCPETLVECQVEGTRLCIDPNNACDGIPNCGSAYAYDEDRVLCGVIHHHENVYLAAVTCLAVLVTMLYVIHYWLQRCVPGVAEAFFVYTDSADNELYLDPIMRSPMDVGNGGDYGIYNSALFDDENMLFTHDTRKSRSPFKRLFTAFPKLCVGLFKKRKVSGESIREQGIRIPSSEGLHPDKHLTGTALRNVLSAEKVNQEVQTGESLEMAYLKAMNAFRKDTSAMKPLCLQRRPQSIHEIELLDFLSGHITSSVDTSTDSPGPSGGSAGLTVASIDEEREIRSTSYDLSTRKVMEHEILKSSGKGESQGRKCLRFDENTTFISRNEDDEDEDMAEASTSRRKHSASYGSTGKRDKRSPHKTDDNDEHGGAGSDFIKFFRKKKSNK